MSARKVYSWKEGRHYAVSAQEFGEWVERLPDKSPHALVKRAADPKCIAHKLFEWDGSRAAHEYRLLQARLLFGSLTVDVIVYRRNEPVTKQVRAVVRTSRSGEYEAIDVAFSDPEKRHFVLAQAIAQLNSFRRNYSSLSELALVFAAIDKVTRKGRRHG